MLVTSERIKFWQQCVIAQLEGGSINCSGAEQLMRNADHIVKGFVDRHEKDHDASFLPLDPSVVLKRYRETSSK